MWINFLPCLFIHSVSLVYRCVPDISDLVGMSSQQRSNLTAAYSNFVEVLNSDDVYRKVLMDLYATWREMLALCGIVLGKI